MIYPLLPENKFSAEGDLLQFAVIGLGTGTLRHSADGIQSLDVPNSFEDAFSVIRHGLQECKFIVDGGISRINPGGYMRRNDSRSVAVVKGLHWSAEFSDSFSGAVCQFGFGSFEFPVSAPRIDSAAKILIAFGIQVSGKALRT